MNKEKLLITGGSGLVGSKLMEVLGKRYVFVDASLESGVDLLDSKAVEAFVKEHKDAVGLLHLAAFTNPGAAQEQKGDKKGVCYKVNVGVTKTLAKLGKKVGWHMVYLSTSYVFDGEKNVTEKYSEEDAPKPLSWYGKTKLWGEQEVKDSGVPYSIVRIGYPYRDVFEAKLDWVQTIAKKLREGGLYPMFTDQWISPVWVDDLAKAMDKLLRVGPEQETYHVVNDDGVTPFEVAQMVAERIGFSAGDVKEGKLWRFLEENEKFKSIYPKNAMLDNEKFVHRFHFKFRDMAAALDEVLRKKGL